MIAANGATARFMVDQGFPSLRRLLQAPHRWDRIAALASSHGVQLPALPDPLGSGEYAAAPATAAGAAATGTLGLGHFGLALNDYGHSTAPSRRFPDLVTQRLLKAAIAGETPPYSAGQLSEIAQHRTLQEDNARCSRRQAPGCCKGALARSSTPSSPAPQPRAPSCALAAPCWKAAWCAASTVWRWAIRRASAGGGGCRKELYRLRTRFSPARGLMGEM